MGGGGGGGFIFYNIKITLTWQLTNSSCVNPTVVFAFVPITVRNMYSYSYFLFYVVFVIIVSTRLE